MNVDNHTDADAHVHVDVAVARIAAAIGEPARARMLYCLIDGRARTSTELAAVADVTPSTASVHLHRLNQQRLVKVSAQGKHRYYSLEGSAVGNALEALSVLAGTPRDAFVPNTPTRLRAARTCYDHIAGTIGVALHDRFRTLHWLSPHACPKRAAPKLTTSLPPESKHSRLSASTSTPLVPCAAASPSRVLTGANVVLISEDH